MNPIFMHKYMNVLPGSLHQVTKSFCVNKIHDPKLKRIQILQFCPSDVKKFADKTNEQRNFTENPVKIKIDVIRQERKIEVRKEIEKSNDSITDQLKPNNDKIIPDKKQNTGKLIE